MNNSIDFYGSWGHVEKQALAVGMQNLSENRFFTLLIANWRCAAMKQMCRGALTLDFYFLATSSCEIDELLISRHIGIFRRTLN